MGLGSVNDKSKYTRQKKKKTHLTPPDGNNTMTSCFFLPTSKYFQVVPNTSEHTFNNMLSVWEDEPVSFLMAVESRKLSSFLCFDVISSATIYEEMLEKRNTTG